MCEMLIRLKGAEFAHVGPYKAEKYSKHDYRKRLRETRLLIDEIAATRNIRLAQPKILPTAQALQRKCRSGLNASLDHLENVKRSIKTAAELETTNSSFVKLRRIYYSALTMMASTFL